MFLQGCVCNLCSWASMNGNYSNASASSSSSLDSSTRGTEDDQTIAIILGEEEKLKFDGTLGKRLCHLNSIPVCSSLVIMSTMCCLPWLKNCTGVPT